MDSSTGTAERTLLSRLAKAAVKKARGDREAAARTLTLKIRATPSLLFEAAEVAARYLTRQAEFNVRATVHHAATQPNPDNASGLASMARSMLDTYVLPNGVSIGDAKRDDLQEAIDTHLHNEEGNRKNRLFITAIKRRVRGNKTVRQCMSADTVLELWKEKAV